MKPNQEISLKFWYVMIAIFAVVLSIPFCDYLYANNEVKHIYVTGILISCLFFLAFNIDLLLRNSELKSKLNKETFFNKVSAQTITDYDKQIKDQESKINDVIQAFEDAVAEITELRIINNNLFDKIKNKTEILYYWKERALHQKHTKKVVESDLYLCIKSIGEYFIEGKKYKRSGDNKYLLHLIGESGSINIVNRHLFKPVKS